MRRAPVPLRTLNLLCFDLHWLQRIVGIVLILQRYVWRPQSDLEPSKFNVDR